jgi:hypothetical protein
MEGYVSAIIRYIIPTVTFFIPYVLYGRDLTHLGAQVDDLVTLQVISGARNGCGSGKFDVVRVLPDGTSPADPFRVPEGRALVITELDWYYFNGAPGATVILAVFAENLRDASKRNSVFQSPIRLGPDGVGGASERMTSGFAISSAGRVCVDVLNGAIGYPVRLSKVLLRGYLVNQR